jgi:hypothetical protein
VRESRCKQISASQTPEHWPLHARENASDEQRGEPGILARGATFDRFVQVSTRESAVRKMIVDCGHPEWQDRRPLTPMPLGALQIAAHLGNRHGLAGLGHPLGPLALDSMFLLCSRSSESQMDSLSA